MTRIRKTALAVAMAGALSAAAVTPSFAQHRPWVAAGAGFAAGALIGAAAANAANSTYYYTAPSYGYAAEPSYVVEPGYVYEPEPTYVYPRTYYGRVGSPNYRPYECSTDEGYGRRSGCDR